MDIFNIDEPINKTNNVIEINNLTKIYYTNKEKLQLLLNKNSITRGIRALDSVSLEIKEGEIFGLLGANGSGKTTLIKLLCGLISPNDGSIKILGKDVQSKDREEIMNNIGAIVEAPTLFKDMSGYDNLAYFAKLNKNIPIDRVDKILKLVGLEDRAKSKFSTYSLGMQQRLGIAQAIIHNPKILILDEPINGLDPDGIIEIRELLLRLKKEFNTTILISSHILSEMQALCDRVGIIVKGKIVAIKTIEEIEKNSGESTVAKIECDNPQKAFEILEKVENIQVKLVDNKIYVKFDGEMMPKINKALVLEDINIYSISIKKRTLEDMYKELANKHE